ncbi:hypothetical protein RFI_31393 [Reticulomyxa filosa]|uniref:Kelch motif family protein n=1 Tax=Reticulomyxa filosa TaxID=46433 RepID=X6LVP5_RETFI|nr:hypothetical protein RFI_31393 [Reticulomyxa filosa]|eukprot:ETO06003.1 hypothetical protein RFI_31393 [Reticulomyxa filosa]
MNQTEETTIDISAPFVTLSSLPIPLDQSQCVIYKHEVLICGGYLKGDCYSYHIIKDQYKFICSYPSDVHLKGHCVIKLINNNNPDEITLLSFGGGKKHTLIMKYKSVWDDVNEMKIENKYRNEWIAFTDNHNNQIQIGGDGENYWGARAIIGGSNNHLLFITSRPNDIDVYNLNTFEYIKYDTLPANNDIYYHCFVSKANCKKIYEMILFCMNTGLFIQYDEDSNRFQFRELRVFSTISSLCAYSYICINDFILFFGGDGDEIRATKEVHKYSMKENKWMKFEQTLPIAFTEGIVILDNDNMFMHIIGGSDGNKLLSTHIKTKVIEWMKEETEIEKQWILEETEKIELEKLKIEINEMKDDLKSKKIKVYFILFFFINLFLSEKKIKKKKNRDKEKLKL